MNRREFFLPLSLAPVWGSAAFVAMQLAPPTNPLIKESGIPPLKTLATPNEDFFIRNHFHSPQISLPGWKLRVTGSVQRPLEMSYADILKEARRELTVTLECAGNGVGFGGVSTATWEGISLGTLLKKAGLGPSVRQIRFLGADRGIDGSSDGPLIAFSRSLPLEKALHPDTLLAFQMNGVPLPTEHGYPLRAIVPGWYGMDSVKWLIRIDALDSIDASHFMTERYVAIRLKAVGSLQTPITRIRVKSLIAQPRQHAVLSPGLNWIRGLAWAGENRVAHVEVSTNGGKDWVRTNLENNAVPYSWSLWTYPWQVKVLGPYTIVARAHDDEGNTQPESRDALRIDSYEQNWYHSVRCEVR